jgi:type I restriction enzyme M protein
MENEFRKKILNRIKSLDPKGDVVNIDEENKKITYNSKILGWDKAKFEDEGFVRALLVVTLVKVKKYKAESIVLEKHYNIGSNPQEKSAFLDILIKDKKDNSKSYMLIEVKTPEEFDGKKKNIETQLFNIAAIQNSQEGNVRYLVYYTIDEQLKDKFVIIDYSKYTGYKKWKTAIENSETSEMALNVIPDDYGVVKHFNYGNIKEDDENYTALYSCYSQEYLNKFKNDLHNILWGGGSSNYNDVIFAINRFFACKIYDEINTPENQAYKFQIMYEDEKPEDAELTYKRISKLYANTLVELLGVSEKEASKEQLLYSNKISLDKFIEAVKVIQGISLTENKIEGDFLGEFFESIITNEFKQDKGQFFTHWILCLFIVEALQIKQDVFRRLENAKGMRLNAIMPYIIDPSCGSGTFLVQVVKSVERYYRANKDKLNLSTALKRQINQLFLGFDDDRTTKNAWANDYIYGIEPNPDLETAAKLNLIFHGVRDAKIFKEDGLASFKEYKDDILSSYTKTVMKDVDGYEMNEKFDYIISNPPFSLVIAMLQAYNERFIYSDKKNSENLFIERWYQLLKEGGKLGVVLPDSIFDTTENKYIREFIYRYFNIDAIVSVDKTAFQPYTSTKVSILLATKKTNEEVSNYEKLWSKYADEYRKLRKTDVIKVIMENDKLSSSLERLNSKINHSNISTRILNKEEFNLDYIKSLIRELIVKDVFKGDIRKDAKKVLSEFDRIEDVFNKDIIGKELSKTTQYKLLDNIYLMVNNNKIQQLDKDKSIIVLKKFLRNYFPDDVEEDLGDDKFKELLEHCYEDIISISKIDYPNWETSNAKKYKDKEHANIWWVFSHISEELDYKIIRAEADNIGYKRTLRGEKSTQNDLMTINSDGDVIIDTDNPKTILDYIVRGSI